MKLNLVICFSFMLTSAGSFAQNTADSSYMEIGLNATQFVNQYLDFGSGDGLLSSPYIVTFEQRFQKLGYRLGLGLSGGKTLQKPENGDTTTPEFWSSSTGVDFRAGAVKYLFLARRWSLKYGIDGIVSYDVNRNWTEVTNVFGVKVKNTNTSSFFKTGISPFLFAQFHVTSHFSVATELLGSFILSRDIVKVESTEFPQFDTRQETSHIQYSITPPVALFFIFRF